MIEVYKHRKNPRMRLYKDESVALPQQAHKEAWELLRTETQVDSDAAQQMEKYGFALARVNLRFDELMAPAAKAAKGGQAAAGRPGGGRGGKPGGAPKKK